MSRSTRSGPDADATRDRILDAAAAAFASGGMGELRLDEVAKAAGFSVASLYNYFENKEDLLRALLERVVSQFVEAADQEVPSALPVEMELEMMAMRMLQVAHRNMGIMAFLHLPRRATGDGPTERYLEVHASFMRAIEARVARIDGIDPRHVSTMAYQFVGMLRTETFRWVLESESEPDVSQVADRLTRFFLAGVRGGGS